MSKEKKESKKNSTDKTTRRDSDEKSQLIARLNRIEGQIRGIKNMVEKDQYCVDIIVQVMAAKAALDSVNRVILSNHLNNCVVNDIKEGKMEKVEELSELFKKVIK